MARYQDASAYGSALKVNSTGDASDATVGNGVCEATPGECTLRAAIEETANATAGTDTITFDVAAAPFIIQPASPLPIVSEPVVIDGTTQPGFTSCSSGAVIELEGSLLGAISPGLRWGLRIDGGGSTVRGLAIHGFYSGLKLISTGGNTVECDLIGTDATGTVATRNDGRGMVVASPNNTIGGTSADARNIISGKLGDAVLAGKRGTNNNLIQGNYVGTDITGGMNAIREREYGVYLAFGPSSNTIGGLTPDARNVISDNTYGEILLQGDGTTDNKIQGNFIGPNATGTGPLNHAAGSNDGILILASASGNTIGGSANGAGNTIAYNMADSGGVYLFATAGTGNRISSNSIFSNGGLGIELEPRGVTPNDPGDADHGPNNLQNFPIVDSAITTGTDTTVSGTLQQRPEHHRQHLQGGVLLEQRV